MESSLHAFAGGAVDFLTAMVVLALILALIINALENQRRASDQRRTYDKWRATLKRESEDESPDTSTLDVQRPDPSTLAPASLPPAFYALQADEFCAQVARAIQASLDRWARRHTPSTTEQSPSFSQRIAVLQQETQEEMEQEIDRLQTLLKISRERMSRLVAGTIGVAVTYSAAAYIALIRNERDLTPRVIETILISLTVLSAILLSRPVETLIARVLRLR